MLGTFGLKSQGDGSLISCALDCKIFLSVLDADTLTDGGLECYESNAQG